LGIHTVKTPLHEDVSLERLARLTIGMSGADLANVVNEAALCAARKDLEHITNDCFEESLARVQLGALRPLIMSEDERRIIAYHEGGHALVAYYLREADTVNRVTILPRGQSLGVTQFIAEEDRYNYSRQTLMAKIAVGLGGRIAEELTLGREHVTTGAENDFQVVTNLARRMVTRWGMSDEVGVVFTDYDNSSAGLNMRRIDPALLTTSAPTLALDSTGQPVSNGQPVLTRPSHFAMTTPLPQPVQSSSIGGVVDREIKKILDEGHQTAQQILEEHFDQLQLLADVLLEREQLSRAEFEGLLQA
jgi:cell division protease FtsH